MADEKKKEKKPRNAFSVLPQESVLYGKIDLHKQTSDWSIKESSGS